MESKQSLHPIFRWAGGKSWLVNFLASRVDINSFSSYHEPFVGGGAILFNFLPKNAWISDSNKHLIDTYKTIRTNSDRVIEIISKWHLTQQEYYRIREMETVDKYVNAARFIYLNHTSYNGLYRENKSGKYNVPWGKRINVCFDFDNIRNVANYLKSVHIHHYDFSRCLKYISEGSLVFLDPPYTITHNKNGFIAYNQKLFRLEDQIRLSNVIDKIKNKGAYYILTNAAHNDVISIFKRRGDRTIKLSRASLIGGRNASRGKYEECIFTNLKIIL